jgi:hypothetical protein
VPNARYELTIGETRRRLAADVAGSMVALVGLTDPSLELLAHDAWSEDDQIVVRRQPTRDLLDEALEVLEAVRLVGGLMRSTASVADGRIVADVAGGPAVARHRGLLPLDERSVAAPAHDDGSARVDPYECAKSRHGQK